MHIGAVSTDEGKETLWTVMKILGVRATPIEVFILLSGQVEPCVKASRIENIDVFRHPDEIQRTRSVGRDFRKIINIFRKGFPFGTDVSLDQEKLRHAAVETQERSRAHRHEDCRDDRVLRRG